MADQIELEKFRDELVEIRGQIKERETSMLRAITTLFNDWREYRSGESSEIPLEAVKGLANAYFFPRIVFIVGGILVGIGGIALGCAQILLLLQQNEIIDRQNNLLVAQTQANSSEAIATILAGFSLKDPDSFSSVSAQLSGVAPFSFDVLNRIAKSGADDTAVVAGRALADSIEDLTSEDALSFARSQLRQLVELAAKVRQRWESSGLKLAKVKSELSPVEHRLYSEILSDHARLINNLRIAAATYMSWFQTRDNREVFFSEASVDLMVRLSRELSELSAVLSTITTTELKNVDDTTGIFDSIYRLDHTPDFSDGQVLHQARRLLVIGLSIQCIFWANPGRGPAGDYDEMVLHNIHKSLGSVHDQVGVLRKICANAHTDQP